MSQPPPTPGSKRARIAVALGRVAFWRVWAAESTHPVATDYFNSRQRHWQHVANSIELEP